MPRQTYVSKEFFVNAPEAETKQRILELPNCVSNIKFIAEDQVRHSMKFLYERAENDPQHLNYIQVSLLPLSVDQTRIALHGSNVNGSMLYNDAQVTNALINFETAIQAAVKGTIESFQPKHVRLTRRQKSFSIALAVALLAVVAYLLKNLLA
ncbi:MAG TPA: hypothetical protein VEY32_06375 [Flavisolibacter sp.]|jgi:hypothetical protein|nr:hypothetical protein [Chitinophagaceae bacterium]HZH00689.1 hypothetical protein [Flavisolibacter sp.]